MRFKCIASVLLVTCLFPSYAGSFPCGKAGKVDVLRANDGSGFMFFVYREGPDIYFQIPGQEISFPTGLAGARRSLIDGIVFETLLVKPDAFMKVEKGTSDLDILKKHREFEFRFIQSTASPLKRTVELGPREKAAGNGQPGFTFYLWKAVDPSDPDGAREYYLTTVSSGEVVVLSAIVLNQSQEETAMRSFQSYAVTFQHILKTQQCPGKTTR